MNKILKKIAAVFLAVLLGTGCLAGAIPAGAADGIEINEINFPDLVFRMAVAKYVDTDKDGCLSADELAVETIYLSGWVQRDSTITTLKGIEHFTSTKLRATDLIIPDMDLSGMKNLQTLTAMNLRGNERLDLSKNTSLKTVSVWGSTEIKSLVLPSSVTKLECEKCSLESLDLRALSDLEFLSCYRNQLTSLDLSGNAKLKDINCSENHIKELDLSANTALVANATDYYIGGQTITAKASFDSVKNISVPVELMDSGRITQSSIASEIPFGYEDSAFVFTDYSMLADGIDYTYSVNLAEAEDMSVHINAEKDFYKVSYLDSENGSEFEYQFINVGGSAVPPELPAMPEGMVCGHYSQTAENVQSDITVYVVWQAEHTEAVTAFKDNVATISCSSCGTAPRTVAFADCLNLMSADAGFEPLLDINADGIINARDLAELSKKFK